MEGPKATAKCWLPVVRVRAKAKRFAMTPHQRFRPAVGGGGAAAEKDMHVHKYACRMAQGVEFTLTSLSEQNQGRWFVPAQCYAAITHRGDMLERQRDAIKPSWEGWMAFGRQTPGHGRAVRDPHVRRHFCQPLAAKPRRGLEAPHEKHEGELVELEGGWVRGQGEIPDALFDPQFVSNEEDFMFCKGLGKSGQRSKYAADYRAVNRMAEGKGKGKDKAKGKDKGKEQPAVGSRWRRWRQRQARQPAVGGKGQLVLARGLPFTVPFLPKGT